MTRTFAGPRDQLDAAIAQLDAAVRALHVAGEALISDRTDLRKCRDATVGLRVDVVRVRRELDEARAALTQPASTSAFERARKHSERAMKALAGKALVAIVAIVAGCAPLDTWDPVLPAARSGYGDHWPCTYVYPYFHGWNKDGTADCTSRPFDTYNTDIDTLDLP